MGEFLVSISLISLVMGAVFFLSYPSYNGKFVKCALLVLLLYSVVTSLFSLGESLSFDDFSYSYEGKFDEYANDYESVSRDAFALGIKREISNKFGPSAENILVRVEGFDFKNMRAEKIWITLTGGGAFADFRAISDYIEKMGLGECEVKIYES